MDEKVDILGVKINKLNMEEALNRIFFTIKKGKKIMVVTPNAEMIMRARKNNELKYILNEADLSLADGAGVLLASKLLNIDIKERVSGFDLLTEILSYDEFPNKFSVYFLGAKPEVVDKMIKNLINNSKLLANNKSLAKNLEIAGYHHGYLNSDLKKELIKDINEKEPNILFVGMGAPLQEKFLKENMEKLNINVGVTVGGSFDVLAGNLKRAPKFIQKIGLEWLYRLIQEPKRFKRTLLLPQFALIALYKSIVNK
ncbi:MAG: WecB/TagA/CpsF family glycosyltransferase [Candidatus Woesearchaeota archaeon]